MFLVSSNYYAYFPKKETKKNVFINMLEKMLTLAPTTVSFYLYENAK